MAHVAAPPHLGNADGAGARASQIAGHEARWLNLLGYSLRRATAWPSMIGGLPRRGKRSRQIGSCRGDQPDGIADSMATDRGRIARPAAGFGRTAYCRNAHLYKKHVARGKVMEAAFGPHESLEMLRLLGALELLPPDAKTDVGRMLVALLSKEKLSSIRPAIGWAIGRLGAELMYGPLNTVLPPSEVSSWIEKLLEMEAKDPIYHFVLVNLARRTSDRFRDIDEMLRERVVDWLRSHAATGTPRFWCNRAASSTAKSSSEFSANRCPKG